MVVLPRVALAAALLVTAVAPPAGATTVILHQGSLDPTSEGWELAIAGDSTASGGTETTASGEHAFWDVRDASTVGGIAYGFAVDAEDLSSDWRLEAIVRVIDSPLVPGTGVGDVGVIVRDGYNYWSFYLSNTEAGPISDSGKTGPHSLLRSDALDTRSDYHRYDIQFSGNGPGLADDTADFFVDGVLVFDDQGRSGLWTASEILVGFGAVSTEGVGEARWEWVRFDDGRPAIPAPPAALLLALGLAGLAGSRLRGGVGARAAGRRIRKIRL